MIPDFSFLSKKNPIYSGGSHLLTWRDDAKIGMTVDLRLLIPSPVGGHPFRSLDAGRELGQRMFVKVNKYGEGGKSEIVYYGEVILLKWSENNRTGMMCRLLLDDGLDSNISAHPFRGLDVSLGRKHGEYFDFSSYCISDDESFVSPSKISKRTPFNQLSEVTQSQILSRDPRFKKFLKDNMEKYVPNEHLKSSLLKMDENSDEFSSSMIRIIIGSPSRSIMNHDTHEGMVSRKRWHRLLGSYMDSAYK